MVLDKHLSALRRTISNIYVWKTIECPPEALLHSLSELFSAEGLEVGLIKIGKFEKIHYIPLSAQFHNDFIKPLNFSKKSFLYINNLYQGNIRGIKHLNLSNIPGTILKNYVSDAEVKIIPLSLRNAISGIIIYIGNSGSEIKLFPDIINIIQDSMSLKLEQFDMEKRFADICDFTPDPTLIMDSEGIIRLWNKAIVDMSGWEADKVLGKGNSINAIPFYGKRRVTLPHMALHPDPAGEKLYIDFRHEKDGIYSVAYCPSLPGGGAYVSTKTSRILDLNNRLFGAIQTIRDVTRMREMERDLERNLKIQKAVNKVSGLGMATFSGSDIIYCNQYMGQILGRKTKTVRLEHIKQLVRFVPHKKRNAANRFFDLLEGKIGSSHTLLLHLKRKNAEQFYQCYVQPDESAGEALTHLIVEDITEKRKLEEKIRLSELRLYHEDRLTALGTMAAGIAHELNQPLNAIKTECSTFLWELEKGDCISIRDFKHSIDTIYQQVERMSEVIRNVRAFSRDEKTTIISYVDLNEAVKNVFSIIGTQLDHYGVKVYKLLEAYPINIKAGMSQLEQIIMNLIVNARQSLENMDSKERTIIIKTKTVEGSAIFYIEDSGSGIPKSIKGKIFDPFFTTKEPGKGTGLGLTISRSIAKDLGGELQLIKSSPKATAFGLRLPLDN